MECLIDLVLLFFAYSFLGWCIEVVLKLIQYRRFINRGFLAGPWLPIYGTGAVLITLADGALSRFESAFGTTFCLSFVLCGAVEYAVSWLLEKRYHARWWDYSQKPMNLNGRVWIGNLVLFGIGGVVIVHGINPVLLRRLESLTAAAREWACGLLLAVFAADYTVSHFVLRLVKTGVERSTADNTEQINSEIRLLSSDRSLFHRRFADAYPEVIYKTERIAARMEAVRKESERIRREAETRLDEMGQHLAERREQLRGALEPGSSIRGSLIEKQDELLALLYREETATEEMRRLKSEIDAKREKLDSRRILRPPWGKRQDSGEEQP